MPTRLIIAYAMITAIAGGGLLALWIYVLRDALGRRGRRLRFHRDRAEALRSERDRAREALEAK